MDRIRRSLLLIILMAAALFFLAHAFMAADQVQETYTTHSFRYEKKFSPSQMQAAHNFEKSRDGLQYTITFWEEESGLAQTRYNSAAAQVIRYSGDAAMAFPAVYIQGGAPGAGDNNGCAISTSAAWTLFGSTDIVGLPVKIDDTVYQISGVFRGESALAVIPAKDTDALQNVELTGTPPGDSRENAITYAVSAGLGTPDQVCYGKTWGAFFAVLCCTPLLFTALWLLEKLLRMSRHFRPLCRYPLWFCTALLFAVSLPCVLTLLPAWLLPTQWGDLSFWPRLFETLNERLNETLSLIPATKDVLAKRAAIKFALCLTGSLGCLGLGIRVSGSGGTPLP